MADLYKRSIDIILENQSRYGSYIASPFFHMYGYCWLRDGSFTAYAMDMAGKYDSADRFYNWVNDVIVKHGPKVDSIINKLNEGLPLNDDDILFTRYTLDGEEEKGGDWGNFQLDGYGIWLWGLAEHIRLSGDTCLPDSFKDSIGLTVKYISSLWFYPNYDIWEENPSECHTSTLAALYGGLSSINRYLGDEDIRKTANAIKSFILRNCVNEGSFVKYVGSTDIDSSLVWLSVPFGVVSAGNEIYANTVKRIEEELMQGNGAHRYKSDTYYGGGEWILLSGFMGLYYCSIGKTDKAMEIKRWMEKQADENGYLPEQVCAHLNDESYYQYWVDRWGEVARPLLWSHALYIILTECIKSKNAYKIREEV